MPIHEWVIDVEKALAEGRLDGDVGGSVLRMPPICRVPAKVREMNEKAYQPEVVSIGPYHHGEEVLQAMEKHKWRALLHFLQRSKKTPEECLDQLRGRLPEIRAAYDNLDRKWEFLEDDDDELFLKMMLMDGCFILEVLLTSISLVEDYDEDDRIFGRRGRTLPSIKRDLLLIENQIPLLVLQELFDILRAEMKLKSLLVEYLWVFFRDCEVNLFRGFSLEKSLHILDLCRRRFIICEDEDNNYNLTSEFIPSAMALQDHGILLLKGRLGLLGYSRPYLLRTLFGYGWGLKLPALRVDDTTESVFLNAMVFESESCPTSDARLTYYVSLMSQLMVSPKDANLLSTELGIIRNRLIGSRDQALVDLFGRLSSLNFLPDSGIFTLQDMISEHCGRKRNRFRAYLNRTYFRNPWARISVITAIILFVLTAVQTFYAVYSLHKQ